MTSPEIDKVFLSGSCKWLNTVDKLDDKVYEIIKNSVTFLNQRDRYFVLEILDKHAKDSTKYVAEILLSIFTKEITYDGREKVKNTIEILYENGQKDIADKICLLHGERGFEVLRELYRKYNNI